MAEIITTTDTTPYRVRNCVWWISFGKKYQVWFVFI